jgi:hypothetical protein
MIADIEGVHVYASDADPAVINYVPGAPSPERDPAGRPTLLLMAGASGGILQLGTRWTVTETELAAIRSELARRGSAAAAATLTFRPAPVVVRQVRLSIGDGSGGTWTPIKSVPSSGYPPWNTILHLPLDSSQQAKAMEAVSGQAGCLRVEFEVQLSPEVAATFAGAPATLVQVNDVSSWFPAGSGKEHILPTGAALSESARR